MCWEIYIYILNDICTLLGLFLLTYILDFFSFLKYNKTVLDVINRPGVAGVVLKTLLLKTKVF